MSAAHCHFDSSSRHTCAFLPYAYVYILQEQNDEEVCFHNYTGALGNVCCMHMCMKLIMHACNYTPAQKNSYGLSTRL